jgi:hypothetical protein
MKTVYLGLTQAIFVLLLIISLLGPMILLPIVKNLSNSNISSRAATWTVMVYMDGDNNLDSYGAMNINDMERGYSNSYTSNVNIIVFEDHSDSGATTYLIRHDTDTSTVNSPVLTTGFPSEPDMGSATTLKNFLVYCYNNYPASHYLLILWDHGGGILGICWDDTDGNDQLTLSEVKQALSDSGKVLDILAMDACLMQILETSYEWHQYAKYIVASEETIPGNGFPYYDIIWDLVHNYASYGSNPVNYANDIVDQYYDSYPADDITLSNVDVQSTPFTKVMAAFNEFATALRDQVPIAKSSIASARAATQEFYYPELIDLWDFADELQTKVPAIAAQCATLKLNITTNLVKDSKENNKPGAHGMAIYFPEKKSDYDSGYETIIALGATVWGQFLSWYYNGATYSLSLSGYQFKDNLVLSPLNNANGIPEQRETINVSVTIKNTGTMTAKLINGTVSCSNGNITLVVNYQNWGTMTQGQTRTRNFQFNVSQTAPAGVVITITCVIQATFSTIHYQITKPLLLVLNLSIITGGANFESAVTVSPVIFHSILPGLDPTDSSAWFKINVNTGKYLICSILSADAGTDFDLYVYRPSGSLLTAAVMGTYPDTCSTLAPETGYYRIRVVPYTGSGAFTLNVTISDQPGPEDGLSFGTAITLHENTTMPVSGELPRNETKKGYQFYRCYLHSGDTVTVTLNGAPSTNFDLVLADLNLKSVASSSSTSYPDQLQYSATAEGYYYIVVLPTSGKGSFSLSVTFEGAFTLSTWMIILIVIIVVIAVIVGLILFFRMT